MQYLMIFVTASSDEEAKKIANALLEQHLVACVNIVDNINSFYWWQGKIQNSNEKLLIIKTKTEKFEQVEYCVKKHHSYQVPEIIAIPIVAGSSDYLNWIHKETV